MKPIPIDDFTGKIMSEFDQFTNWMDECEIVYCHPSWGKLTAEQWCIREAQRVSRMYSDMRVAKKRITSRDRVENRWRYCIWMPGLWRDGGLTRE